MLRHIYMDGYMCIFLHAIVNWELKLMKAHSLDSDIYIVRLGTSCALQRNACTFWIFSPKS